MSALKHPRPGLVPRAHGRTARRTVAYLPPTLARDLARRAKYQRRNVSSLVVDAVRAMLSGAP